jgi:hypothetical protein
VHDLICANRSFLPVDSLSRKIDIRVVDDLGLALNSRPNEEDGHCLLAPPGKTGAGIVLQNRPDPTERAKGA